jgi:hypothetical protein
MEYRRWTQGATCTCKAHSGGAEAHTWFEKLESRKSAHVLSFLAPPGPYISFLAPFHSSLSHHLLPLLLIIQRPCPRIQRPVSLKLFSTPPHPSLTYEVLNLRQVFFLNFLFLGGVMDWSVAILLLVFCALTRVVSVCQSMYTLKHTEGSSY